MKKSKFLSCVLAFALIPLNYIYSQSEFSEEEDDDEDVIVVSAGKIQQSIDKAVEKVQVVDSETIKESGAKTLTEAMKTLPGVTVSGASAGNPTDSISMQGFDSDYVKILVDGVAVSGDIGGSTAVSAIPVENVDHIEVVQGASSALYGSDAMGGVINIITKKEKNEFDGVKVHGSLNEEFTYKQSKDWRTYTAGSLSAAGSKLSGNVTGTFDYTPGTKDSEYYAFAGGFVDYYKTARKRLGYVRGSIDWTDDWGKVGAYGTYADSLQESNYTAVGFDSGSVMSYKSDRIEGGVNAEYNVDNNLNFSGFSSVKNFKLETDFEHYAADSSTGNLGKTNTVTDTDFIDWESEIHGSWKINSINTALFGINGNLQTIDGKSFSSREKQLQLSAFGQDTIQLFNEKLALVPGVRFDFAPEMGKSDASFMVTPKMSLKFDPTKDTAIRFSYGMGYKIPTLKQKYWVFYHNYAPGEGNFILNGNPDLKSEKSQSFSFGIDQNVLNLLTVSFGAYYNYITDMIDSKITDSTTNPQTRSYVNIGKAMTYGGDVSVSSKLDRFSAKVGYAYTGARAYNESKSEWEDLALRVTHRVTVNVGYMIPVLEAKITLNGEYSSRQLKTNGGSDYTPDLLLVSANLSKSFCKDKVEIYVRGENLLDNLNFQDGTDGSSQEKYYDLYDGVTVSAGARIRF